jgi:hypothetical protein
MIIFKLLRPLTLVSKDGLSTGLVFVLNVIGKYCRPDNFKETVLQTLAAYKSV